MAAKKKSAKKAAKKIPRQQRLPGMKDAKITALQNAAMDYAEIRDARQELTKKEVDLKARVMNLMHKHNKETYDYQGVHIELVHEQESVKVRIKKAETDEDEVIDSELDEEPEATGEAPTEAELEAAEEAEEGMGDAVPQDGD